MMTSNVSLNSERKRRSSNEILRKTLAILYNFMETRKMFFYKGRLLSGFTRKIRLIVIRMSMTKQKCLSHTGYFSLQNFNNIPVSSPQTDNLSFIFTWHLDDNCWDNLIRIDHFPILWNEAFQFIIPSPA